MAVMPNENVAVSLAHFVIAWVSTLLNRIVKGLLRPSSTSILIGSVVDLSRSKTDLIAENALLRHQLAVAEATIETPKAETRRSVSLLLAKVTKTWLQALLKVLSATLLRRHREGYRLF